MDTADCRMLLFVFFGRAECLAVSLEQRQPEKGRKIMKIKALPAEERPMEKGLYQGMEVLSNTELLALVINSGTKQQSAIGLAEDIICRSGSIAALRDLSAQELMEIPGIGPGKASRILAALELGKRISAKPSGRPANVDNPDDIAALFMEEMRSLKQESFRVLLLNTKGDILSVETISVGELNRAPVHPREVFRPAVKKSAAAVILIHNHPSGDPRPSSEDIHTTVRLMECGRLMGIRVLDHLIIGDGEYISLSQLGAMNMQQEEQI